jgi:signal transduction histidine kinase/ActR/RegA family two-component response regulator
MVLPHVKRISVGFVALGVGLSALGAVLLHAQKDLVESSGLVSHTREVSASIESVKSVAIQTSNLLRDYVLSASRVDRDNYRKSCEDVFQALDKVKRLTNDDPDQQKRIDRLNELYQTKLKDFDVAVSAVANRRMATAKDESAADSQSQQEVEIAAIIEKMKAAEDSQLDERLKQWNTSSTQSQAASLLLLILNFFIMAATFVYIRREVLQRIRSEQQLIEKNSELNEARDAAMRASMAKGRFLADMSHEIRTPLNGVVAMASLLVESSLAPKDQRSIETILDSSQTLLRIVNDVLDLSKIEAERLELVPKPANLLKIVRDVESLYQGRAQQNETILRLSHNLDPELSVNVDDVRLKQILGNLVGNAVKFTRRGDVNLEVNSELLPGDRLQVHFSVSDTGPGIPEDQQKNLFEAFQLENDLQRELGGTGLGLSIAQRLANLMDSKIAVETAVGRGSKFSFVLVLPVVGATAADVTQWSEETHRGARILLAEDNSVNVIVATTLLESLGCEVTVAWNGQEAIEMYREGQYDMILMDMRMPVLDGPEATRAIRRSEQETGNRIPVIAVTANAFADDRRLCFEAGMDDFLSKPFTLDSIREVLARWNRPRSQDAFAEM